MHDARAVLESLQSLLDNSRRLVALLNQDRAAIEKNDLLSIEEGNIKKETVNQALLTAMHALDKHPALLSHTGDLFDRIKSFAETRPRAEARTLLDLINRFKQEVPGYKQSLHVNRMVIHANLKRTKDMFCTLLNQDVQQEVPVYKSSGLMALS